MDKDDREKVVSQSELDFSQYDELNRVWLCQPPYRSGKQRLRKPKAMFGAETNVGVLDLHVPTCDFVTRITLFSRRRRSRTSAWRTNVRRLGAPI